MLGGEVILFIEDDDAYAEMMRCVLSNSGINHCLVHLNSGVQAQAYLTGVGEFSDRKKFPLPCLILADLKMPGMTGLELLNWVRQYPAASQIPFVILTSSEDLKDVTKAYQLGANSFLMKPPSLPDLVELFKGVKTFWSPRKTPPE